MTVGSLRCDDLEGNEDEQTRRKELETLHTHRVEQARYAVDVAERRYKEVDPANRLVAGRLEGEWEAALAEFEVVTSQLDQLQKARPVKLSDDERQQLRSTCADLASLWREGASIEDRKQIARLLLRRVEVDVHNNTERVSVRLHWSGGFESCHEITRTVVRFRQLESYEALIDRMLELTLRGERSSKVASALAREGFRSPRSDRAISPMMVQKLLLEQPRCRKRLADPPLAANHWRSADLAKELGIPEKRLKHWVTRGWATAIQRPHGRVWVIYADEQELNRLQQLACSQTGQGRPGPPEKLRTPTPIPEKSNRKLNGTSKMASQSELRPTQRRNA